MDRANAMSARRCQELLDARARYGGSPTYDDVAHEVSERIRQRGSIGKLDVGALLFWKRLRADTAWVTRLMSMDESAVRAVTATAVSAVNDHSLSLSDAARAGRASLSQLPGFATGDALASAVLFAAAPERMAVYDRRAHLGLRRLCDLELGSRPGRYARYMAVVEELMQDVNATNHSSAWLPRDVDLALYVLGERLAS